MSEASDRLLDNERGLEKDDELWHVSSKKPGSWHKLQTSSLVPYALIISLIINIILAAYVSIPRYPKQKTLVPFSNNFTNPYFPPRTEYGSAENLTHADELYESLEVYVNTGFVALDRHQYGLPPSHPFPWDTSKEIYVLNAFHLYHCIYILYTSLRSSQATPLTDAELAHAFHCLDAFKSQTECEADDTPYVLNAELVAENDMAGVRQTKTCRNWQEMEDFALANSACFENLAEDDPRHGTMWEWMQCPQGGEYERYRDRMDEYVEGRGDETGIASGGR